MSDHPSVDTLCGIVEEQEQRLAELHSRIDAAVKELRELAALCKICGSNMAAQRALKILALLTGDLTNQESPNNT